MDALDREFNEMCDRLAPPGSKPSFPPASAYAPSLPLGTQAPATVSPADVTRLREEFTQQLLNGRYPPASPATPPSPGALAQMRALFAAIEQNRPAQGSNPPWTWGNPL